MMISVHPPSASASCCPDGVVADHVLLAEGAEPRLAQELEERIAVLEALNHGLQQEAQRAAEQAQFQVAEVEHRLMNTFATLQALMLQTARPGDTGEAFRATFGARLLALARSHQLLGPGYPHGAPLAEVVGQCLQPYEGASGRIAVFGPTVHLPARDMPALGLVFHELTTNAAKYGAFSVPEGRVEVTWQLEAGGKDQVNSVVITWRERGGPPVKAPERRGFGSRLLERGLAHASGGSAQLDFASHGVVCRIRLPLSSDYGPT